jgi:hypothetical protein
MAGLSSASVISLELGDSASGLCISSNGIKRRAQQLLITWKRIDERLGKNATSIALHLSLDFKPSQSWLLLTSNPFLRSVTPTRFSNLALLPSNLVASHLTSSMQAHSPLHHYSLLLDPHMLKQSQTHQTESMANQS